ncbi:probable protein phosphatase CG10417 isoform X1 [Neodiprion lecontei]|uniref:protein-serine/threonine phosphatase n=1 Tax=Neodiprion lecontei TaxID=441921 RepID=A0A6J0CDR3_NEOLC|nr:probable protein phosphatase CG10417 isoform X1 [Neodiprion lecontei]
MGAYLSEPITDKVSSDEVGDSLAFGASSMQGWRISQEDAHNCCLNFDKDVSLFAVYDGHGGHEVATYCAQKLPQFIKDTDAYKNGDIEQALKEAFLGFDATLAKPEIVTVLKEIAGASCGAKEKTEAEDSDEEENVCNLRMEAAMPLEQVMAKYQSEVANPALKALKKEKDGKPASPYLRARRGARDKAGSSSLLTAGCSSSSSWHDNEADVSSSSSQLCGSTSIAASAAKVTPECIGSSEAEQVLDSTTSNGESGVVTSPKVTETVKSSDMPDSSEDIKEHVSPSKAQVQPTTNDTEVNGTGGKAEHQGADSSKGGGDNVTSSSCSTVENGEAEQQERISSSGRRRPVNYELLCVNDGSEEDDDDEEDETFDGLPESDDEDDDTEDVDNVDDDDDNDDDDDSDEDDMDPDDDDDECTMDMTEEPGSDSGCTAVVAVLAGRELYVANAGDSRCVLCRNGQAVELSLDHKPEDQPEMQRIVKAGGKVTADGRVNGGLNLSRALGDHSYKQNAALPPQEQMISAEPDIKTATIDPEQDEFMVLACDGIWNFMSSQDVVQFVSTRFKQGYETISQICEELFDHCLAPNTLGDGTGCDNMTAVIVRFKKPSAPIPSTTEASDMTSIATENKKRPASPIPLANEGNISTGEETTPESKRQKTETV